LFVAARFAGRNSGIEFDRSIDPDRRITKSGTGRHKYLPVLGLKDRFFCYCPVVEINRLCRSTLLLAYWLFRSCANDANRTTLVTRLRDVHVQWLLIEQDIHDMFEPADRISYVKMPLIADHISDRLAIFNEMDLSHELLTLE
jgi:hypothetical protein